jgi:oligopeptide transport system substrate-binding protein
MPGHSTGIGLPYDPDQARRLLAEAGYPGGRGFPVMNCLSKAKHEIECEYLSQQWRENLGIEMGWQTMEWVNILDRLDRSPPPIFHSGWSCDYPDPDNILRMGCQVDWTGWRNKTYFDLVHRAGRITNQAERMDLYRRAEQILIEEASIIPLLYNRSHRLIKPWVTKFPTSVLNWYFWKDVVIEPH